MAKSKAKSKNYDKVRAWYLIGMWSNKQLDNAVGKWITQEEHDSIKSEKEKLVSKS